MATNWKRRAIILDRIAHAKRTEIVANTSSFAETEQETAKATLSRIENLDDVGKFSFDKKTCVARVLRVLDGDTIRVALILDGSAQAFDVRLQGIDAPEMKPRKNDPDRDAIKREAINARNALRAMLLEGSYCRLQCGPFCKFGRILAIVYDEDGQNVNDSLVQRGFCIDDAQGRIDWSVMWPSLQKKRAESLKRVSSNDNTAMKRQNIVETLENDVEQPPLQRQSKGRPTQKCNFCCFHF